METTTVERSDGQMNLTWDEAIQNLKRLTQECEEAHRRYDSAFERFCELQPDPDMIPKNELPLHCERDRLEYDLDGLLDRFAANHGTTWWGDLETGLARKRAAIEAVLIYRERHAQANALSGVEAERKAADASADAVADAESVLIRMPAPHAQAVLWKVRRLVGPDDAIWDADYLSQFYADAERFLGREA